MKRILLYLLVLITFCVSAQETENTIVSFCGKVSSDFDGRISIAVSELRSCSLVIVPADTAFHVTKFVLTIQPLNNPMGVETHIINNQKIPHKYIEKICAAKMFRIEKITLTGRDKMVRTAMPILIAVQQ